MKKTTIRIFALALAVVMLTCMFAGCGKSKMNVKVGVKLSQNYIDYMYEQNADKEDFIIPAEHRVFLNDVDVEIAYEEGESVSALDALITAAAEYGLDYTLDSTEKSVAVINDYKGFLDTEKGTTFFWSYTINGVEPTEGRAADNYVKEGDVIVFTLTSADATDFDDEKY